MEFQDGILPQDKQPALRVTAMPADANASGDIFGGWIMAQVDVAGSIPAARRAKGRVVTVAVTEFLFKKPVFVGDVISCYADIVKVGRSSITVDVSVYATSLVPPDSTADGSRRAPIGIRNHGALEQATVKVTEAKVVYVAVDEQGSTRPLPPE
ncbi:MAG: acyl-CoA thioesterase [Nitrospinae bacterium]|nr:acyl-CoA thioesterase [Nitrospinota bacterium]